MAGSQGKTEKPTQRRLEKARKDGNFVASRELVAAGQFLVFLWMVGAWFPDWLARMKQMLRQSLAAAFHGQLDITTLPGLFWALMQQAAVPLLLVGALTATGTLALHLAITRFGFSLSKLTPDFKRFNPATKIKNIVQQGPVSMLQAGAMLVLFGGSIYYLAAQNAEMFLSLPFASLDVSIKQIGGALKQLLWKGAGLFVLFGALDMFRQYRRFMNEMKMTKLEIRDESKESEGSPEVKGRIRRLRRDLARRRMMKEIATATTVIVNPTHYAVAIRYRHDFMATPVVVAKGKNYLALRIRKIALENQIPLVENPPLAQALYKSVDVGREIPPHLYRAVAEVLAYIYRLTNVKRQWNLRGAGTARI